MKIKNILYVLLLVNIMTVSDVLAMRQANKRQQPRQSSRRIYPPNLPLLLCCGCLKNEESCLNKLPLELIVEIINHARKIKTDQAANVLTAVEANDKDKIRQLLNEPYIDINAKNKHERTPLNWATRKSNPEIVQMLLDNGADPNIQGKDGSTALHWAIIYNKLEIVQMLLDNGANPNIQDFNDCTALWWAIEIKHVTMINLIMKRTTALAVDRA